MAAENIIRAYNPHGTGGLIVHPAPHFCTENILSRGLETFILNRRKLPILPVLNNPAESKQLKSHVPMSVFNGFAVPEFELYTELSLAAAEHIKKGGTFLTPSETRRYPYELSAAFLLYTNLVLEQYFGRSGELKVVVMSKAIDIVGTQLEGRLTESRVAALSKNCATSEESVFEGRFKAIKVELNANGSLKNPSSYLLNLNKRGGSIITTLGCVFRYADWLRGALSMNRLRICYYDQECEKREIIATINGNIIHRYWRGGVIPKLGCLDESMPVMLTVFDTKRKTPIQLPITGIVSIKVESSQ